MLQWALIGGIRYLLLFKTWDLAPLACSMAQWKMCLSIGLQYHDQSHILVVVPDSRWRGVPIHTYRCGFTPKLVGSRRVKFTMHPIQIRLLPIQFLIIEEVQFFFFWDVEPWVLT